MSNIYQHNFHNCRLRLSNSDYWDHFISYDCKGSGLNHGDILSGNCHLISIDVNDDLSLSGNTLYNLKNWTGATIQGSGVTLNDIGLTGVDNGLITYTCSADTTGSTFINTYTGSTLFLSSADTRFFMTAVSGCNYDYSISYEYDCCAGRCAKLCGGFYQGFFKLSDRTFFTPKDDNKFTWDPADFCLEDPLSGNTLSGTPYNYQVLPTRHEKGWTGIFWLNKDEDSCSGTTATTLNDVYSGNSGFFFYMGTRAENKFWNVFSGETGYTTSSGIDLSPPSVTATTLSGNPFLVYSEPTSACTFDGEITTVTTERDRNADIIQNALGFRVTPECAIGYRYLTVSGECSGDTYVSGITIEEGYSDDGVIPNDWAQIVVRFTAYNTYEDCELINGERRKGRLDFYVNGLLVYTVDDFDEFLFKDLNEHREKQQGVPFNYSFGGGTQGLIESQTIGGSDPEDSSLTIEENFAGTFNGCASKFDFYGCSLDVTTIRYDFCDLSKDYGIDSCDICPDCDTAGYLLIPDCFIITENGEKIKIN
jgi:hypothetical protein